jgi:hypothetical protein
MGKHSDGKDTSWSWPSQWGLGPLFFSSFEARQSFHDIILSRLKIACARLCARASADTTRSQRDERPLASGAA